MNSICATYGLDSGGQGWFTAIMQSQPHSHGEPPETAHGNSPRPDAIGEPDLTAFWSKVDKRGDDDCWPWTAGTIGSGYGAIRLNRKMQLAHRVARQTVEAPLPGQLARHLCDNRLCCNPSHIAWGDVFDNYADRRRRKMGHVGLHPRHPALPTRERTA